MLLREEVTEIWRLHKTWMVAGWGGDAAVVVTRSLVAAKSSSQSESCSVCAEEEELDYEKGEDED